MQYTIEEKAGKFRVTQDGQAVTGWHTTRYDALRKAAKETRNG